jgi:uncharacterized RDD family membrane protein YckC
VTLEVPPFDRPAAVRATAATLPRRWAALFYEALLLGALLLVAGFAVLPLVDPGLRGVSRTAADLYLLEPGSRALLLLYYVAVSGAYCIGFWSNGRRTLPMKTWGLALVLRDGGTLDIGRATRRFAAGWIGPAAGLAGYAAFGRWGLALGLVNHAWAWIDRDKQFLHDRLAGTRIIRSGGGSVPG